MSEAKGESRPIVLHGGESHGKIAKSDQDFIYVMDESPALHQDEPLFSEQGEWNKNVFAGRFRTAHRYNATGSHQNVSGLDCEVFEYVGDDMQNVFFPFED